MSVYFKSTGGDYLSKSTMWMAKPSIYAVNGSGRDSYIAIDNGGLYYPYEPSYNPETGTFKTRRQNKNPTSSIEAKYTNYTSDGSGRDSYIRYLDFNMLNSYIAGSTEAFTQNNQLRDIDKILFHNLDIMKNQ